MNRRFDFKSFFKSPALILSVLFLVISVFIFFINFGGNGDIRLGGVFSDIQSTFTNLSVKTVSLFRGPYFSKDVYEDYLNLKNENTYLKNENTRLESLKDENIELKKLLGLEETVQETSVPALIVNRSTDVYSSVLTINKGTADGITENMVVLSPDGYLVGRISSTGKHISTVTTVADPSSGVPVYLSKNREPAVVRGNCSEGDENCLMKLLYLPVSVDAEPGDKLVTSGMGGLFRSGIEVGKIFEVNRAGGTSEIAVVPSCDFSKLTSVLAVDYSIEDTADEE